MAELFAAGKEKKNESKTRKVMWFEYIINQYEIPNQVLP
jgi:hypothetical protein